MQRWDGVHSLSPTSARPARPRNAGVPRQRNGILSASRQYRSRPGAWSNCRAAQKRGGIDQTIDTGLVAAVRKQGQKANGRR